MNTNVNVIPLFPTPVLAYNVEIEEKEKLFFLGQYPDNVMANTGNLMSKDLNILNNPQVQELNKKLLLLVNDAFTHIHNPLFESNLYITQSWLNFTSKDQHHHQHFHPNSFYSAVLYLKTAEDDSIIFYRPGPALHNYEILSSRYGIFNSITWQVPVKDNLLLIFPSTFPHSVPSLKNNNLRVSLSFNTYFKGQLGTPTSLNYLKF